MKIIIVGEYSGFAKNLSIGFRKLSHECIIFSWGDVFKKIDPDERTYLVNISNYRLFGKILRGTGRLRSIFSAVKLHQYVKQQFREEKADIILVINMAFLKETDNIFVPRFSNKMLQYMCKQSGRIFLSACGNDYIFNSYLPLCDRTNEYLMFKHQQSLCVQKERFITHIDFMNKVIPVVYDYSVAYKHFQKEYHYVVLQTIPLPFDTSSVSSHNELNKRIVIMHGVTRQYEKGSTIIISALEKISMEFKDKVDIRIVRHLPLKEYLKIMTEANIVVDQLYGGSNGMNTTEALAMGKVVLSGCIQEYHRAYTELECPVVNIEPNSNQIYTVLKHLIESPEQIKLLSQKSRAFAEAVVDSKKVAQKYINVFEKELSTKQ